MHKNELIITAFPLLKMSFLAIYLLSIIGLILLFILFYYYSYRKYYKKYSASNIYVALKEKNLLKQLFDNMPDRIYFKDRESRFIIANKHVATIMGEKDPDNLIGKTDFDFYEDKYAKAYFDDEQHIMSKGKPMIGKEEKGLNIEGEEIFVSTSKIPIKDKNNNVIGIIGIGRDITPQKRIVDELRIKSNTLKKTNDLLSDRQEEIKQLADQLNAQAENLKLINTKLKRLSLVASKTENVVIIMDENGNFEWVNNAFELKYGMDLKTFTRKYGLNLRDNSSKDNITAILNQIYITRKPFTYTAKYIDENGNSTWFQSNISPILNPANEILNLILIDSDINDLKIAEAEINSHKSEIEKQAAELAKLNNTKDRLFSIIGHDLKNPFNSILGFVDILLKKYKDIDREKLFEFLSMIQDSSLTAYHLLGNLLEWARAQTKNVKLNPVVFNVYELIAEVIALQSLQASAKKINLINNISKAAEVFADRQMLNTVIRNISSNGIKFTNEGGTITYKSYSDNDTVRIEISDNGVGMPEETTKQLFELDKVKSSLGTSGESGTGLGLIICADFIKLNKGTIEAKSTPGKGSTFILTLPANSENKDEQ